MIIDTSMIPYFCTKIHVLAENASSKLSFTKTRSRERLTVQDLPWLECSKFLQRKSYMEQARDDEWKEILLRAIVSSIKRGYTPRNLQRISYRCLPLVGEILFLKLRGSEMRTWRRYKVYFPPPDFAIVLSNSDLCDIRNLRVGIGFHSNATSGYATGQIDN